MSNKTLVNQRAECSAPVILTDHAMLFNAFIAKGFNLDTGKKTGVRSLFFIYQTTGVRYFFDSIQDAKPDPSFPRQIWFPDFLSRTHNCPYSVETIALEPCVASRYPVNYHCVRFDAEPATSTLRTATEYITNRYQPGTLML